MKLRLYSLALALVLLVTSAVGLAQNTVLGAISNLPGKVDSNNALAVSFSAIQSTFGSIGAIGNQPGKVDSNNALVVSCPDGSCGMGTIVEPAAGNYTVSCVAGGYVTVLASSSGGASPVITIPDSDTCSNMTVTVVNWNPPSTGTGLHVDVAAGDYLYGNGFTGAMGKGAVLTLATQNPDSDLITVRRVATNSWLVISRIGTWAREV